MSNQYLDCYRRVSTTQQKGKGNSLQVQLDVGKKVSKQMKLKFRDRNEGSHSSIKGYREVLESLKDDIEKGKVKNIWTQSHSRMFRDLTDSIIFRREYLQKYDVTLYEGDHCREVKFDTPQETIETMSDDIWSRS